jgi:hypothetical protein
LEGRRKMDETTDTPWWSTLLKYFAHGLAFSLILTVLVFVWALILVVLAIAGAFIGLIIGFLILLFIIGGLNSFLTDLIWAIPVKTKWTSLLGHGFVLLMVLVIVHIPAFAIALVLPNLAISIALFIVYAFIDGFIAKIIAGYWEEEEEEGDKTEEIE